MATADVEVLANHGRSINGLSCTADGRILTAGFGLRGGAQVCLWSETGEALGTFGPVDNGVCWYAEMSPDGRTVAAGFGNLTLGFWDVRKKATEFIATPGGIVASLGWSADSEHLLTGNCGDKTVRLWDAQDRVELRAGVTQKSTSWFVALSPDGTRGISGSADKLIHVWDTATMKELAPLEGHTGKILFLRFSADGRFIASGSQDKSVRLWDVAARTSLELVGHRKPVTAVAFFPKGDRVASTSGDGTVRVWSTKDGSQLGCITLGETKADAVAVSAKNVVLAGCQDGTIRRFAA